MTKFRWPKLLYHPLLKFHGCLWMRGRWFDSIKMGVEIAVWSNDHSITFRVYGKENDIFQICISVDNYQELHPQNLMWSILNGYYVTYKVWYGFQRYPSPSLLQQWIDNGEIG